MNFEERPSLFAIVVKAIGECNQMIYEEALVELFGPPDRRGFDDNSVMHSDLTASATVRDAIENGVIITNMTSVGAMPGSNRAFSPVNDDSDKISLYAIRGDAKGTFSSTIDDSHGLLTRRSRSLRKSKSFGKSRSMGRGEDKEHTRGFSPTRRSRPISPRRSRSPRRALSQQRPSAFPPRNSRLKTSRRTTSDYSSRTPTRSKATSAFSERLFAGGMRGLTRDIQEEFSYD
jgi:hypothetical protein